MARERGLSGRAFSPIGSGSPVPDTATLGVRFAPYESQRAQKSSTSPPFLEHFHHPASGTASLPFLFQFPCLVTSLGPLSLSVAHMTQSFRSASSTTLNHPTSPSLDSTHGDLAFPTLLKLFLTPGPLHMLFLVPSPTSSSSSCYCFQKLICSEACPLSHVLPVPQIRPHFQPPLSFPGPIPVHIVTHLTYL